MQRDTQFERAPALATTPPALTIRIFPPDQLPADRLDEGALTNALNFAASQLTRSTGELTDQQFPKSTQQNGTWTLVAPYDASEAFTRDTIKARVGWTQGFFPGLLWYMYYHTGNTVWRDRARKWTLPLAGQRYNFLTHDMGFKFMPSHAVAYTLTNDRAYRETALLAAGSMATRYNPRVGIISCCDWNDRPPPDGANWRLPLVTDTMMDLELLFWAARENAPSEVLQGQEGWADMALNHALTTLRDMVRANGSTYHVVDYEPSTGAIRARQSYQGAGPETTWSRGHAWAMYGYTMAYRYTGDARMLTAAQRVTDYYLSRVSGDMVPNWDFDSPTQQKDSSAAAIAASALIELSTQVTDATLRQRYWKAAVDTLRSLVSPNYLAQPASSTLRSILQHGVGDLPHGNEVDVGLIYGDYYFLEALLRYRLQVTSDVVRWDGRLDFAQAIHTLTPALTGTRTIEFDMMANAASVDGVVGYADTSTNVTAYNHLAMSVRMNPGGYFDVRNGGAYGFVTRVNYTPGTRYHVRIVTDLVAKRYSVWVRAPGGSEIQIATNYAFRSDAPAMDDLGKVAVKSGNADNEFAVEGHKVV